ncbi:hypothetical protein EUV21_04340 [Salmonella enterica subsp. enterica serovar Kinondoni]|nr:hypothetical protein [Salmonella enterica subsp. enterica serovar Kinondoni]MKU01366.1 hypothetical protein [Salmonella enterica subsp. enterica serovar Kinondoni]
MKFFEMTTISGAGRLKTASRNRGLIPPKGVVLVALPTLIGQHTPSVLTDGGYKKANTDGVGSGRVKEVLSPRVIAYQRSVRDGKKFNQNDTKTFT